MKILGKIFVQGKIAIYMDLLFVLVKGKLIYILLYSVM